MLDSARDSFPRLDEVQSAYVLKVWLAVGKNGSRTARILGVTDRTVRNHLARFDLTRKLVDGEYVFQPNLELLIKAPLKNIEELL